MSEVQTLAMGRIMRGCHVKSKTSSLLKLVDARKSKTSSLLKLVDARKSKTSSLLELVSLAPCF